MRIPLLSRVIFVLFSVVFSSINAQKNTEIQFKTGDYIPKDNVNEFVNYPDYNVDELVNGNYYRIIQFSTIPSTQQKEELKNEGIELLNYMPKNAFYASISKTANLNVLLAKNAIAIIFIAPEFKLNRALRDKDYSDWAMIKGNMIEINAIYYSTISEETILTKLQQKGLEVTMSNDANIVRFIVDITELDDIYTQSEFYYFEEIDKPGEPENLVGRSNHRSNTIATEYFGGLKFDGTGVTVMLQDNSKLDQHIDYAGRFTNYPSAIQSGDHGEHCGGIIAGAGNLDPRARGMAFGAEVLVFGASDNNFNDVPTLFANDNLTITSKSYSNGTNAGYTSLAQQLDQQIRTMPELIHIFSAGNGGSGWSTITGGHKQGKNVMAVANLNYKDIITTSSGRGPAADGRIKPDISAVGTNVYSTNDPNNYTYKTGTSMSCPGVAGIMAQLYDAYKSINGGINPNSALMKAAVLNTGDDLGNIGPDYIYGWGRINARRAYNLFSNNNYVSDAISQGGNNVHSINVPAGTAQLRVMVYWSDYEGSASANPALVNDINMQIVDPAAILFNPWVLNPSSQNNVAVRGIDNLNNVEQITIDNPLSGNYTINISGVTIPQGPQEYYVVHELIQNEVVLTYPIGREGFNPGTVETIRWDSYGGTGTFNLEYSTNNGGSWNTINASVSSVLRYYEWTVPSAVSGEVLVRVTRGALSSVSDAVFSIIPTPINLSIDWACPDSMQLSWDIATGAIAYEVSMLGNKYMDSVDVTNANSYVFYGVNPTLSYWVSVRSLGITSARGERALALEKVPGTFGCSILIDAALSSLTPSENAELLDCMIGNNIDVTISIKNEGIASIANIPMDYQLNGGAAVNEIYAGPLASGATFNYTFSALVSPTVGTNTLLVWSDISGDGNFYNDSVATQFTYVMGTVQNIPWSEDFESFSLCGTLSDCELEICNLSNGFVNEANGSVDDIDWRTDQGGTASMFTGPGDGSDSGQPDFNPG
ncbi:MAG: S8 family serine peptidase, partial [Flavobacteriales bacterium]|nr:S8 family serine peptidase [Flavobacteriales bacterium]